MKILLAIVICLSLVGCGGRGIIQPEKLNLPQSTMQSCEKIERLKDSDDVSIKNHYKSVLEQYAKCSSTNEEKKKVLEKLSR